METKIFAKLDAEIKLLEKQGANLTTLANHVSSEAFDDEDRRMVHDKQVYIASTKKHLQEVLDKKKEIYHTQIKTMETRLSHRQAQLETFSKENTVFQDFPDVLEFFARKQNRLTETLATVREKLIK